LQRLSDGRANWTFKFDPKDPNAERIAVDSYREIIQYIGDKDPTTRRLFEEILAQEEEHADDMADILESL
jgi:bacterioferritin